MKPKNLRVFITFLTYLTFLVQEAERLKAEGNQYFKDKNFKKALASYAKVFCFLNGFQHKDSELYQYAKSGSRIDDNEFQKISELKYTTYLNMAQIDLYNKNYKKCVDRATESIKIHPTMKGYFRRGCAYLELNDLDNAESDFNKCLLTEPNNVDVKAKIVELKKKLKQNDNLLKDKLKGMFI